MNTSIRTSSVSTVRLGLVNGTSADVQRVPNAVAVERDSNYPRTVAEQDGHLYLLTPCCGASSKGSFVSYGVFEYPAIVCRECYREVSEDTGMALTENDIYRISPAETYRLRGLN